MQVSGPGALSDVDGETTGGDWTLLIQDLIGGDSGTLHDWCLSFAEELTLHQALVACSFHPAEILDFDVVSDVIEVNDDIVISDLDVAVDIRKSSPTFGQWVGEVLSAGNRKLIWIPPGFAHGFLVLSEFADFEYKLTDFYAPEHERSIRWDDPDIAINWPLTEGQEPLQSDKDAAGVALANADIYA